MKPSQKGIQKPAKSTTATSKKFKTRYSSLGFSDKANLDEGAMWPMAFALKGLTAAEEARFAAFVKKAVS